MHIPDGFLSPPVWATFDAIALPSIAWTARRAQQTFEEHQAPLLGVMGAFVFAAQMINFPVGIGTSGHLVGAALLTFTVGPAAASIVMTAILILQSLVFQDGGVLALGANVTNMALAGVLAAYLPVRILSGKNKRLVYYLGGFFSVMTAAVLALSELLVSGVRMPRAVLALSLMLFLVSALIEGAITLVVMQSLEAINPNFIKEAGRRKNLALNLLLALSLAFVTVGFLVASSQPDGIWSLAGKIGLDSRAHAVIPAPFPDYRAAVFGQAWVGRAAAGTAGLLIIYFICLLVSRFILRRRLSYSR